MKLDDFVKQVLMDITNGAKAARAEGVSVKGGAPTDVHFDLCTRPQQRKGEAPAIEVVSNGGEPNLKFKVSVGILA